MTGALTIGSRNSATALGGGTMAPPPQPRPQSQQQQGAPQASMPQQAPAPSHAQAVATLRHFQAITDQLKSLLQNPDLGKADLKSTIIDGVTKLVAERMIPADAAVTELSSVPDRPYDQKQWAMERYVQTLQAADAVLDHHRQSALGTGNYDLENALHDGESNPDNHMATMQAMMQGHYSGAQ